MTVDDWVIRMSQCNCYVRHLDDEARFSLRWGAHNPACPAYWASLDPVDRRADEDFRARVEITPPTTHATKFPGTVNKIHRG